MSDMNDKEKQDATARLLEAILPANHKGWHTFCGIEYSMMEQKVMGAIAVYTDYTMSKTGFMATASGGSIAEVERQLFAHAYDIISLPPPASSAPWPSSPGAP